MSEQSLQEDTGYDRDYYARNAQEGDRPALWFYACLVKRFLAPGPILDFGCGTGFLLRRIKKTMPVSGFENSSYCRLILQKDLPGVPIHQDLQELAADTYQGIVALHVFEHISDSELQTVLKTFRLSLKSSGKILCVMPDSGGRGRCLKGEAWSGFRDPSHINLKTADEWQAFFVGNGFRIVKQGTDGLWDFPYKVQWPRWLNLVRFAWGTVFQFLLGRLLLPAGSGESAIFLLAKK